MSDSPRHVCLIDGSGYIFRAYYGLPPMNRADGTPTNAVFGFCNMVFKLVEEMEADHVGVIFDRARRSFRNDIYPAYKAHRPEAPEDLIPQFPLVREAAEAFNLPAIDMEGYEADDLIATYAEQALIAGARVTIVSSDKDLMQLVGNGVVMWDPMKSFIIGPDQVREKFGVGPERVVDVQALAGDSTDNVPGVEGIGIKTAAQLIKEYGDLDSLLARSQEIKQPKRRERLTEQAEMARISRNLVTLRRDVAVDVPLSALARRSVDCEKLLNFLREQQFRRLIVRFEADFGPVAAKEAGEGTPAPDEADYTLIRDGEILKQWVAEATAAGMVAVDTETTGLNQAVADLVGISLCVTPGRAAYIPLTHRPSVAQADLLGDGEGGGTGLLPGQIPLKTALALLKPLLEDPSVLKVGQNIKYDQTIFARNGIQMSPLDDTMLMSFVLEGGAHGHGMDELAKLHLNHTPIAFKDVAGAGKSQVNFERVSLEKARDYAAEDADITLRLHGILKPRLLEERMLTVYETLERPLIPVLAEMERTGIVVEPSRLRALSTDFAGRIAALEREIHDLAGRPFNVGSPKQIGEVLFGEMGLPGGQKTKTGVYSTGVSVLEKLAAEHAIAARILDWRGLSKLKSTYADALLKEINPTTGRVHTSYMMTGAQTGRLSSTDPNLQNIPVRTEEGQKIREAFIAAPGHVLVSLDYSQIELRLVAEIAGVEPLRQAFRDGLDIHAMTASEVFGMPMEGMDPMARRQAKAINFGIIYGISAFGLARQIGVSNSEAKTFIDRYFSRFPGIRQYMENMVAQCRQQGFVQTLYGRRIHLGSINDKNPARRQYAERQAINAPVQGTAADIIKRAMIRVPRALREAELSDVKMLLQVHDELIFEVPESQVKRAIPVLKMVMETAAGPSKTLSVPLVVDAGTGLNWREAH